MKRSDLARVVSQNTTAEHNGMTYQFQSPSWETVTRVQEFVQSADNDDKKVSAIIEAMKIAVQGTVIFEDGGETTEQEAEQIVIHTGLANSPIGKTAFELCGLRATSEDDETDNEPEDEYPF